MTVSELIELLKQQDPNAMVVVDGYEDGYDEPRVLAGEAVINANWDGSRKKTTWSGRHDVGYREDERKTTVVVVGR